MKIKMLDSYEQLSQEAAAIVVDRLEENSKLLLCAATGSSPTGTYELLLQEHKHRPHLFTDMSIIKLDEWGGIPMDDPGTCESYLQQHLIQPLRINASQYISFKSQPLDPGLECKLKQQELELRGTIDICIVGIGVNGHIALNEPADFLEPQIHVASLAETTLQHQMVKAMKTQPSYGLTLGMGDILQSKMVILLISGISKQSITRSFLEGKVTTHLPASFLWLHPNVVSLISIN
jgi:galactosamine-6-phosphate isomerase